MQPTIRLRLTLLYTGLFLIAGLLLLGGSYRLIAGALPVRPIERRIETLQQTNPNSAQLARLEAQLAERRQVLREMRRQAFRVLIVVTILALALGWLVARSEERRVGKEC